MGLNRLVILILISLGIAPCAAAQAADLTQDSLQMVKKQIAEKKAILVDVREKSEWDEGHVAKAVFLPLSALEAGIDSKALAKRLPKDKIIYTHCVVGKRSVTAGNILEELGYNVRPLKPGYKELIRAGFKRAESQP